MTGKIKILSGWSEPGGSTVAHINLCNLFNSKGLDCTFYGPHDWHLDKCRSGHLKDVSIVPTDSIICHFLKLDKNLFKAKKYIFSCHETNIFSFKEHGLPGCDLIHFVSESQKKWQNVSVPSVVIPNVLSKLDKAPLGTKAAGVIGSIDSHKQTHLSIQRAWDDGYSTVYLFGKISQPVYFENTIFPLLQTGRAFYKGHLNSKQEMYNMVDAVYHSSKRETFNFVKAECLATGVEYKGLDSAESDAEYWPDDRILNAWTKILY